jgi:hypothetical protein
VLVLLLVIEIEPVEHDHEHEHDYEADFHRPTNGTVQSHNRSFSKRIGFSSLHINTLPQRNYDFVGTGGTAIAIGGLQPQRF